MSDLSQQTKFNIPGLIPDSLTTRHDLTKQQVMDQYPWEWEKIKQQPYIGDPYQQRPYQEPNPFDDYKRMMPDYLQEKKKQTTEQWQDKIKDFLYNQNTGKSDFEKIIDVLFSTAEKEQFLIDLGYRLTSSSQGLVIAKTLADDTIQIFTETLDQLFLKHITIKFKNLLLAKDKLKIKMPNITNHE